MVFEGRLNGVDYVVGPIVNLKAAGIASADSPLDADTVGYIEGVLRRELLRVPGGSEMRSFAAVRVDPAEGAVPDECQVNGLIHPPDAPLDVFEVGGHSNAAPANSSAAQRERRTPSRSPSPDRLRSPL